MLKYHASSQSPQKYPSNTRRIRPIKPSITLRSSRFTVLSITPVSVDAFRLIVIDSQWNVARLIGETRALSGSAAFRLTHNVRPITAAKLVYAIGRRARRADAARVAWVAAAADVAGHDGAVWRWGGGGEGGESC